MYREQTVEWVSCCHPHWQGGVSIFFCGRCRDTAVVIILSYYCMAQIVQAVSELSHATGCVYIRARLKCWTHGIWCKKRLYVSPILRLPHSRTITFWRWGDPGIFFRTAKKERRYPNNSNGGVTICQVLNVLLFECAVDWACCWLNNV